MSNAHQSPMQKAIATFLGVSDFFQKKDESELLNAIREEQRQQKREEHRMRIEQFNREKEDYEASEQQREKLRKVKHLEAQQQIYDLADKVLMRGGVQEIPGAEGMYGWDPNALTQAHQMGGQGYQVPDPGQVVQAKQQEQQAKANAEEERVAELAETRADTTAKEALADQRASGAALNKAKIAKINRELDKVSGTYDLTPAEKTRLRKQWWSENSREVKSIDDMGLPTVTDELVPGAEPFDAFLKRMGYGEVDGSFDTYGQWVRARAQEAKARGLAPKRSGQKIDNDTARTLLSWANNDPNLATALAKDLGYLIP